MAAIEVLSPSDGTLSYQHVDDGVEVSEGEPLCEIEIMKMQNGVHAPASGIVRWRYSLGEVVAEGDVIAVIEGD